MSSSRLNSSVKFFTKGFAMFGELSSTDGILKDLAINNSLANHFSEIERSITSEFNKIQDKENEKKKHQLRKKGLQNDT